MRRSQGQYRQSLEQACGLVMTVMVATPEAVRRGFMRMVRTRRSSSVASTFQLAQRMGSRCFVRW